MVVRYRIYMSVITGLHTLVPLMLSINHQFRPFLLTHLVNNTSNLLAHCVLRHICITTCLHYSLVFSLEVSLQHVKQALGSFIA